MRKGFTLIEVIVVIAIIAILAAIIAPNAFKAIEKAKVSRTIGDHRSIKTAVAGFHVDTSGWPTSKCEESLLVDNTCTAAGAASSPVVAISNWDGPYLESWPSPGAFGTVTLCNSSGTEPCNEAFDAGDEIYLGLEGVGADAMTKIDAKVDDGTNTTGIVRWVANLSMLIADR